MDGVSYPREFSVAALAGALIGLLSLLSTMAARSTTYHVSSTAAAIYRNETYHVNTIVHVSAFALLFGLFAIVLWTPTWPCAGFAFFLLSVGLGNWGTYPRVAYLLVLIGFAYLTWSLFEVFARPNLGGPADVLKALL